ncbi:MAG: PAS domain-containing protein [Spirochaetota bacterium]|nr:MAG: PAS domain-containing protein [Spirochaetota bacterium]
MIGKLNEDQLEALLETIPIEFSIVDENDRVVAWNRNDTRIFKRSEKVLGLDVHQCHPKKSLDKVEAILSEMKDGKRESAEFWIDMDIDNKPDKVLIRYFAMRDKDGKYIGCMEASQKVGHIQSLKGEKRLLD